MTTEKLKSYKQSGRSDISIVWKLPTVIFFLLVAVYIEYQLKVSFISAYLFPLSLIALVAATGLAASLMTRWSKIRSVSVAAVIGAVIGLSILYSGWTLILPSKLSNIGGQTLPAIAMLTPFEIIGYAAEVANIGRFTLSGTPIAGGLLVSAWILEALALLLYPAYKGFYAVDTSVFCEKCNQWTNKETGVLAFLHPAQEMLESSFLMGDLSYMDQAKAIFNVPMNDYFRIDGSVCYACNDFFSVTLNRVYKASDIDKGRVRPIIKDLVVARAYFQHLQVASSHFPAPERD